MYPECKYINQCYLGREHKEGGKHRVIYTLYCAGRKQDVCERLVVYHQGGTPLATLLPNGIIKRDIQ